MSDTPIEVLRVKSVHNHPKADRLEIVKVLFTQFISQKGNFKVGDLCIYFPPDMLIPEHIADSIGVKNYLKHAIYPGDLVKTQCRIGAIRLRGIPSYGFGIDINYLSMPLDVKEGDDLTKEFKGMKYQPPLKVRSGDYAPDFVSFHTYTDIQHYYKYAKALKEKTPVRITEKIHGTNSRVGYIDTTGLGDMEFMCGTHRTCRKEFDQAGNRSLYWLPFDDKMKAMLEYLSGTYGTDPKNVIVFGEIFGYKVQPMDYGQDKSYRVFDIMVNGRYLGWEDVRGYCHDFGIKTVPLLYEGPFSLALIDQFISGPTIVSDTDTIKCDFKGREGIVITPLEETYSDVLNGQRLILKAVSPDYYEAMK